MMGVADRRTFYDRTYREAIVRARRLAKSAGSKVRISAGRDERKPEDLFFAVSEGVAIPRDANLVATVDPSGHVEMSGTRYHRMMKRRG